MPRDRKTPRVRTISNADVVAAGYSATDHLLETDGNDGRGVHGILEKAGLSGCQTQSTSPVKSNFGRRTSRVVMVPSASRDYLHLM